MAVVGAFAIVRNDLDQILICHRRDRDLWNLPGGKVEPGESPWDAVVREAREETGVDLELEALQGVYSKPEDDEIVFSFCARIARGVPASSDETDRIQWVSPSELPTNFSARQAERIQDSVRHGSQCVLRSQPRAFQAAVVARETPSIVVFTPS